MDAEQLLQTLAVTLGLPDLRFDHNGCARLAIDGAPALNFERDASGGIHLYSVLCSLPSERREAVYEQLLKGNLFGTATAGATLAVDELHREIVLCRTVSCENATGPGFSTLVEAFVGAAEDWQGRLSRAPEGDETPVMPVAAQGMMQHFLRL